MLRKFQKDRLFSSTENLTPSESKKLRNKQRKARKRAEQEAARQKAEQERREAINRGRDKDKENDGGDTAGGDSRDEEKLDPRRLCRVSARVAAAGGHQMIERSILTSVRTSTSSSQLYHGPRRRDGIHRRAWLESFTRHHSV